MRFHLSDDQLALTEAVGRYVRTACDAGLRRAAFEAGDGGDPAFWSGLLGLGIAAIPVAEERGGLGLGLIDLALVAEVLGYEAAPGPFLGHALAILAIEQGGSPAQQAAWLPRLLSGETLATVALAESDDRWRPEDWVLPAGDRLTGTKTAAPTARRAALAVVGTRGGGLALVDLTDPGVHATRLDGIDRTRPLGTLAFAGAPAEPLQHGDGARLFDALLTLVAADGCGGARRMLDLTVAHVRTREQFDRPVGAFQAVKHQLANLAAHVTPCDGLVWHAAIADAPGPRAIAAAFAKAHVADRAMEAARTAVELHGGIGYTWDYDLQIWVKRAYFDFAYGGTPAANRAHAVALKEAGADAAQGLADLI